MQGYPKWFVLTVVFAIFSGLVGDAGHVGLAVSLAGCALMFFLVIVITYLDSGSKG